VTVGCLANELAVTPTTVILQRPIRPNQNDSTLVNFPSVVESLLVGKEKKRTGEKGKWMQRSFSFSLQEPQ
jgi:hypothetical protein